MSIPGVNVMLMGAPGTGKTHSLRTLAESGIETSIVFTEPGMEVLGDTDKDLIHWKYIPPAQPGFASLIKTFTQINTLSNDALQKLPGIEKKQYSQAVDVLNSLANFKCERCGKELGDVTEWGTDKAIVLDSLTGLNIMLLDLAVGAKPLKTLPDWGVAMDQEERLINLLTLGTKAHFVLAAHLERQVDEVMGGMRLLPQALGRKMGPALPRFFSDVILTERQGTSWTWSTAKTSADTKARNVEWKDGFNPSFVPLINHWKQQTGD